MIEEFVGFVNSLHVGVLIESSLDIHGRMDLEPLLEMAHKAGVGVVE